MDATKTDKLLAVIADVRYKDHFEICTNIHHEATKISNATATMERTQKFLLKDVVDGMHAARADYSYISPPSNEFLGAVAAYNAARGKVDALLLELPAGRFREEVREALGL